MDEEQKQAARKAADDALAAANEAVKSATTVLKAAQDAKDDAAIADTTAKVKSAEDAATKAQAEVDALAPSAEDEAARILADGTDPKKEIKVPLDKFKNLSEQAKLFEQFGPVLAKLKENPTLLEKLMAGDDPSKGVEERLKALEARETAAKQAEVKSVITRAIATWSDFSKHWDSIKPIVAALEQQGISYADAVQRAYFSVNPDATKQKERLVNQEQARDAERRRGAMGAIGGGSGGPIVRDAAPDEYQLTDQDREFAAKAGIDPKLYSKHADWINRFRDL